MARIRILNAGAVDASATATRSGSLSIPAAVSPARLPTLTGER